MITDMIRTSPDSVMRYASTVLRSHILGSFTAIALIVCTAWVCSYNRVEVATIQFNGANIDLREASTLVENADQWRLLYTVNYQKTQTVDQRVDSIATWLPRSVDWSEAQDDIHSIAESVDLSIVAIKRGDDHVGTRVGVVLANCDVQGSYASLCRFLHALSHQPKPIACSEIRLQRVSNDATAELGLAKPQCRAALSLRIPFAASGTASGRLLPAETKNAG
jgi:Tfp pilus assembly protein PilO